MADTTAIVHQLLDLDEDELTAQIGMQAQSIEQNADAASLSSLEDPIAVPRAGWSEVFQFGQSIFEDASVRGYKLLCTPLGEGNSETAELVQELEKLLDSKTAEATTQATALLAPVLVGSLGLPQSLAVMIATLLVKRLAKGTSDLICDRWQNSLGGTPAAATPPVTDAPPASA